jgi:hypothetical protein
MARLTDISIKNLKPSAQRREIPDQHQRGLYCIVQPTGAKVFAIRYRFEGRPRKLTLQPGISLAAARKEILRRPKPVPRTNGTQPQLRP